MNKFLNTDIAARIISVILAIIVWIYIVILLDPAIDIPINDIPIIYTNTINLTNNDYILLNEKSSNVSIKIRGSRTMLAKINKSDITAYVDLNGNNQTGTFSVPISVRLPYEEVSVVEKKPLSVNIQIDKLITQTFPVTVEVLGKPQEGFEIYKPTASQSTIQLKGPSDIVTSIERVVASLNVADASSDVVTSQALTYYNTNEDDVTSRYLSSTPEKIEVRCSILKKKVVPVKAVLATLKEREMLHYEANVVANNYITILAKPEILEPIIEIYTKPIDVSNIKDDTRITAQLDMPVGVFARDDIDEVTVDVSVKKQ